MKLIIINLLTLSIAILITSCEGYCCGNSIVLDKITGKPLDNAYCEVLTGVQKMHTDSTGQFDMCNQISGCVPDCKDIRIRLSKTGYKIISLENPNNTIIYLKR